MRVEVDLAATIIAVEQLIYAWGEELDQHDGTSIDSADLLTDRCVYQVAGRTLTSRSEVGTFYRERQQRLSAASELPVMRHVISNVRLTSFGDRSANAQFLLLFFAAPDRAPNVKYCDPLALAEVRMSFDQDLAGEWLISRFDSVQTFTRE